jgi:hypothetical protein
VDWTEKLESGSNEQHCRWHASVMPLTALLKSWIPSTSCFQDGFDALYVIAHISIFLSSQVSLVATFLPLPTSVKSLVSNKTRLRPKLHTTTIYYYYTIQHAALS